MMTNLQARLISLSLLAIASAVLMIIGGLATLLGAVALFGCFWMYLYEYKASSREQMPTETRCRRCHRILLALSEPRCPECGERI